MAKTRAHEKPGTTRRDAESRVGAALLLVGREPELRKVRAGIASRRNLLLEGPVGAGKTHLVLAVTAQLGRPVFRVDGDGRYSEQKMTGWFDPPTVMKKGFTASAFIEGPLVSAMRAGGVLFINELNRLPEGVQNVLLPALDERRLSIPRIGEVAAHPDFVVVATQNPKEFVATSHLSEALLDRFELIPVDYQSEAEESAIVREKLAAEAGIASGAESVASAAVRLARATRVHPKIRRGASIRAALAIADLTAAFLRAGSAFEEAFVDAAMMALPTRIEIERDAADASAHREMDEIVRALAEQTLDGLGSDPEKKKS